MANGSPIEQAREHLETARRDVQEQIERLQHEAEQLDAALAALPAPPAPRRRGRPPRAAASDAPPQAKSAPANGRRRRVAQSRPGTISAAVEDFLDSHHPKAVHASEILDHLVTVADREPGGNSKNVLQSTLNRLQERGTVRNVGRNRWRRVRPRGRQPAAAEAEAEAEAEAAVEAEAESTAEAVEGAAAAEAEVEGAAAAETADTEPFI